ncbi:MAG: hypothetical protein WC703_01550 [Candidatus Neomarinimicrobiota bacterium]
MRNFLQEVLEKKGYHVAAAIDDKTTLQTYGEQGSKIDLIISNIVSVFICSGNLPSGQ